MYSNMKYYENICNCLRVIQQDKKQEVEICQLLAADLLKPIYHIKHRLAVVKFLRNQDSEKKSNFIFSDFVILLICL